MNKLEKLTLENINKYNNKVKENKKESFKKMNFKTKLIYILNKILKGVKINDKRKTI